jgi:hypothetical protein
MAKRPIKAARRAIFSLYFVLVILGFVVAGVWVAGQMLYLQGFPQVRWLWNVGLPHSAQAMHADPWLLLAFVIVAVFLWSFPWEELLARGNEPQKPATHRRGRDVAGSKEANERAYQELLKRRAARRAKESRRGNP